MKYSTKIRINQFLIQLRKDFKKLEELAERRAEKVRIENKEIKEFKRKK